jgi:hypothetical protein
MAEDTFYLSVRENIETEAADALRDTEREINAEFPTHGQRWPSSKKPPKKMLTEMLGRAIALLRFQGFSKIEIVNAEKVRG